MGPTLIQRRAPSALCPTSLHRDQRKQANAVSPGSPIEQPVVVDLGEDEHHDQAADDPEDLLGVEAGEPGVQRGRVDLKHRDGAEQQHHAEQRPVEVAKAHEAADGAHGFFQEMPGSITPRSEGRMGSGSCQAVPAGDLLATWTALSLDFFGGRVAGIDEEMAGHGCGPSRPAFAVSRVGLRPDGAHFDRLGWRCALTGCRLCARRRCFST